MTIAELPLTAHLAAVRSMLTQVPCPSQLRGKMQSALKSLNLIEEALRRPPQPSDDYERLTKATAVLVDALTYYTDQERVCVSKSTFEQYEPSVYRQNGLDGGNRAKHGLEQANRIMAGEDV